MPKHAGTQEGQGKDETEVARRIYVLATGVTVDRTRKEYNSRLRTFANIRAARGKEPLLLEKDGAEEAVRELTTFMPYRCLVYTGKNQSQTEREYLWATTFFHKMYAGWELPTRHCTILAMEKGFDRVQCNCEVKISGLESHCHGICYGTVRSRY